MEKDQKVWRFTLGRKKSKYLFKDELRWYKKVSKKRLNFAIILQRVILTLETCT